MKCLRTLIIKMILRTLLASCIQISAISVNGSYTHSVMLKNTCNREKNFTYMFIRDSGWQSFLVKFWYQSEVGLIA